MHALNVTSFFHLDLLIRCNLYCNIAVINQEQGEFKGIHPLKEQ